MGMIQTGNTALLTLLRKGIEVRLLILFYKEVKK
jgi:hypothetical protein